MDKLADILTEKGFNVAVATSQISARMALGLVGFGRELDFLIVNLGASITDPVKMVEVSMLAGQFHENTGLNVAIHLDTVERVARIVVYEPHDRSGEDSMPRPEKVQ